MASTTVRTVHLVAKTHLDLGFTGLATEVVDRYLFDFFPRALTVAEQLASDPVPHSATGERAAPRTARDLRSTENEAAPFVWTTGSWILREALDRHPDPDLAARIADGVRSGVLTWHGLPVTTHTELLDAAVFDHGLGIAADLDRRFGRRTRAAKMTDVPGHTRAIVPLLARAGIDFLHIGVNPVWPVPDVPPVFRWRSPDGAEIVVAYSAGGYGDDVTVDGSSSALVFCHTGDNLGPPTTTEVRRAHADAARRYPNATVRASTLTDFANDLLTPEVLAHLPVITDEIGDPWLFGAGSDPQKLARHRRLLAVTEPLRARLGPADLAPVDEQLLLAAEHTWGLDQKIVYPTEPDWDDATLARLRTEEPTRQFEASWAEQRAYIDRAEALLTELTGSEAAKPSPADGNDPGSPGPPPTRSGPIPDGARVPSSGRVPTPGRWRIGIDVDTGGIVTLHDDEDENALADPHHVLGALSHQLFSAADYDRFLTGLAPEPHDEWWAIRDNTKPGIEAASARSDRLPSRVIDARWNGPDHNGRAHLHLRLTFARPDTAPRAGAPVDIDVEWSWSCFHPDPGLQQRIRWATKAATRLPEATWVTWNPIVERPDAWQIDKLGTWISPLEVVRHGGRSLHAMGAGGLLNDGADRQVQLQSHDAPLAAPGTPNLLDADPPPPDLSGGWHVLLHDNCWGTNFPMWNEGPAAFNITLHSNAAGRDRTRHGPQTAHSVTAERPPHLITQTELTTHRWNHRQGHQHGHPERPPSPHHQSQDPYADQRHQIDGEHVEPGQTEGLRADIGAAFHPGGMLLQQPPPPS